MFLGLTRAASLARPVLLPAVFPPVLHLPQGPEPGTDPAAEHETVLNGPAVVLLLGVSQEGFLLQQGGEVPPQEGRLLLAASSLAADQLQTARQTEMFLQQVLLSQEEVSPGEEVRVVSPQVVEQPVSPGREDLAATGAVTAEELRLVEPLQVGAQAGLEEAGLAQLAGHLLVGGGGRGWLLSGGIFSFIVSLGMVEVSGADFLSFEGVNLAGGFQFLLIFDV